MKYLKKAEIDKGFESAHRTYLCGNLQKNNGSKYIQTDAYEIGITEYSEYTIEKPHYHAVNTEYNYVIDGCIKVLLINEKRELLFCAGDLFVITPNEPYVCKGCSGTRVLFSKVPGGNDKVIVETSADVARWGNSWEAKYGE